MQGLKFSIVSPVSSVAVVWIRPLASEPPHGLGVTKEKKNKTVIWLNRMKIFFLTKDIIDNEK